MKLEASDALGGSAGAQLGTRGEDLKRNTINNPSSVFVIGQVNFDIGTIGHAGMRFPRDTQQSAASGVMCIDHDHCPINRLLKHKDVSKACSLPFDDSHDTP